MHMGDSVLGEESTGDLMHMDIAADDNANISPRAHHPHHHPTGNLEQGQLDAAAPGDHGALSGEFAFDIQGDVGGELQVRFMWFLSDTLACFWCWFVLEGEILLL